MKYTFHAFHVFFNCFWIFNHHYGYIHTLKLNTVLFFLHQNGTDARLPETKYTISKQETKTAQTMKNAREAFFI